MLIRSLGELAREAGLGFVLARHGGQHDVYRFGSAPLIVPRHGEINEMTARAILRAARREAERSAE